jgi:hypothetical protein
MSAAPPNADRPARLQLAGLRPGSLPGLLCLALVSLSASALTDPVAAGAQRCPNLLMEFECRQYQQRLAQAPREQRMRIEQEYRRLIDERRRSCRAPLAGDLPRLYHTLQQAGLSVELLTR